MRNLNKLTAIERIAFDTCSLNHGTSISELDNCNHCHFIMKRLYVVKDEAYEDAAKIVELYNYKGIAKSIRKRKRKIRELNAITKRLYTKELDMYK